MVPGKSYRLEDYVEILWRRKWAGVIPFVLIAVGTMVGTQFLPDQYRSEARILVVPPQVPENFVPTVASPLDERLRSISQQILSRTWLERTIQDFNLYPEERQAKIMEDVIDLMRKDTSVSIERPRNRRDDPRNFTVSFVYGEPRTAMRVTERLASLFISENLQGRAVRADQTTQFLQAQLDDARRRLVEHERKVEAFQRKYSGRLPSQLQSNLQVMQSTQVQLQAVVDAINRDRDRQIVLDKSIADLTATIAATPPPVPRENNGRAAAAPSPTPVADQLRAARAALAALELRLKPEHPDVIRAKRAIRDLEPKADAEALSIPLAPPPSAPQQPGAPRISPADQKRLSDMQAEHDTLDRRIAQNRESEARLQNLIPQYRSRVEAAPALETEQTELTRDYATLQESYTSLLARSEQSKIAADVERQQIGEQFKVIDPARIPEKPLNNRLRANVLGSLAGLAFGLALIALFEYRDTSLRTDDDVMVSLALPVLAVIPAMITRHERERNRRRLIAAVSASAVATFGAIAVALWKFNVLQDWMR